MGGDKGKTFTHAKSLKKFRYDGIDGSTLYELKPYNARSIRAAIKQLKTYQAGLPNIEKLVLVLY
jgi:hypothetical protein